MNTQMQLFTLPPDPIPLPPPPPKARRTDPETSHIAAVKSEKFADSHASRILKALEGAGELGMTAGEIGKVSGLTVVQVDRRMVEIKDKVKMVGERFCTEHKSHMRAWRLK